MRRKHEFGHGVLVSVTKKEKEKEKRDFVINFFYSRTGTRFVCTIGIIHSTIRKDIHIQDPIMTEYKYIIVDKYLIYSEIQVDNFDVERFNKSARTGQSPVEDTTN